MMFMKWRFTACVLAATVFFAVMSPVFAYKPVTFEKRVLAQEAVERVYYNHRIWHRENTAPKPSFEQAITTEQLRKKVTDYMKKSEALEKFWQHPITPEQLQAEMDRMTRETKDPAILQELFFVLKNDPVMIAECLARPALADRLARNWYANDKRFHEESMRKAETALSSLNPSEWSGCTEGHYQKVMFSLNEGSGLAENGERDKERRSIGLSLSDFQKKTNESPMAGASPVLRETPESFEIIRTVTKTDTEIEVDMLIFSKENFDSWIAKYEPLPDYEKTKAGSGYSYMLPYISNFTSSCEGSWTHDGLFTAPDGRYLPGAVWTGAEMIVWGGNYTNAGGRYNPATDTWTPTSNGPGVPVGRQNFSAVWTGTEMIVWGGDIGGMTNSGGRYNPITDSWLQTSVGANVPDPRRDHTAIWTGTEMIVWGGSDGSYNAINTGARYRPSTDTWTQTSTGANLPDGRFMHSAVWTLSEMIVWGGYNNSWNKQNTGGRYNPASDTWASTSTGSGVPDARVLHTAVWTGTEMIIWGGEDASYSPLNSGGKYNPASDTWAITSTGTGVPDPREEHTAVWTGSEMIVWGGSGSVSFRKNVADGYFAGGSGYLNTGARYNPVGDTWTPTSTGANLPTDRTRHSAIWTGSEMIVWGGYTYTGAESILLNTGGRYNPTSDTWLPTSTTANAPLPREAHTGIWTGSEMIIWGGQDSSGIASNSGGRFNPATGTWSPTFTGVGVPSERAAHSAIWTGTEMIVWGGRNGWSIWLNTGGKYNPVTDSWTPTSTGVNLPDPRSSHIAVFTGTKMIVWGGEYYDSGAGNYLPRNTGGRYDMAFDSWEATSTGANVPSPRVNFAGGWTGAEMIVWGGRNESYVLTNTGGRYNPSSDTWLSTSTGPGVPSARSGVSAVWADSEMVVWGGWSDTGPEQSGGRYSPTSDTWAPTSIQAETPAGRSNNSAVWTGTEMIIWGGGDGWNYLNTGGRYTPILDSWKAMSTGTDAPSGRTQHSAVWTDSSMIVWGGNGGASTATGGIYTFPSALTPTISGNDANVCPDVSVTLSVTGGTYTTYQWLYNGSVIQGATSSTYEAGLSGNYSVIVTDTGGCGSSTNKPVTVIFCSASEVSPVMAIIPLRLEKSAGSSTGYYMYFQKIDGTAGYSIYEGNLGNWYSHGGSLGNVCDITITDLGTGEMRSEVLPGSGSQYYLATAHDATAEGPSGFDSIGNEIPAAQSTCVP